MVRAVTALCIALGVGLSAAPARAADRVGELGGYERAALELALARRGLSVDEAPEGKVVDRIHVVNLAVFGEREGFLQFFNILHRTTREHIIAREVLLRPGQRWDDEVVEDSRRRLNDRLFTNLVVIVPVRSDRPGAVGVLVVTRDIWSLRMNSNIEIQDGVITKLLLAPSENNLFGWRKQLAMVFAMDQGAWSIGPLYVDKNVLGTRLQFRSRVRALFARSDSDFEGTASSTSLTYPLWSLRRLWGAGLTVAHFDGVERQFLGRELRPFPDDGMAGEPTIPFEWERRVAELALSGTRSFGYHVKQRVTAGYDLRSDRSRLPDGVAAPADLIDRFEAEALPRSERTSTLVARYQLFTPRYVRYRNIDTFSLAENGTLGPNVAVDLGWAVEALGSEVGFVRGSAAASWTFDLAGDGFVRASAGAGTRLEGRDMVDNNASGELRVAAPTLLGGLRVVAAAKVAARWDEQGNRIFVLGGDSGLRGFPIGGLFTTPGTPSHRFVRTNLELRTRAVKVWFSRLGGVAFWDMGGVAARFDSLGLRHDVGAGFRLLTPQLQPFVFRFDVAVPLNGPTGGLGGTRVIFGSFQAF